MEVFRTNTFQRQKLVDAGIAEAERRVEGRIEEDSVAAGRQVERDDQRSLCGVPVARDEIAGAVQLGDASERAMARLEEVLAGGGRKRSVR